MKLKKGKNKMCFLKRRKNLFLSSFFLSPSFRPSKGGGVDLTPLSLVTHFIPLSLNTSLSLKKTKPPFPCSPEDLSNIFLRIHNKPTYTQSFFFKCSKSKFFKSTGRLEFRNAVSQGSLTAKPKEKQASKAPTFERLCLGKPSTTPFSLVFEDKPRERKGSVVQGMKLQAGGQLFCASISPCPVSGQEVPRGSRELVSQSLPEL